MNHYSSHAARIASLLCLFLLGLCAATKAADPCDISVLQQEIQTKLAKNYPDWQPEKLENMDEEYRGLWTKANPNNCPGIAIGHFESMTELSYALLLVSKPGRKRLGFRVIVFSRNGPSTPFVEHLVTKWNIGF